MILVHLTRVPIKGLILIVNAGFRYTQYSQDLITSTKDKILQLITPFQRTQCPPVLSMLVHPDAQISPLDAHIRYAIFPLPFAH